MTTMMPTAIAPDAKGAASLRGRSAGSAKAGAGPDFDGVLASLGDDGAPNADGKVDASSSAISDIASGLIASSAAGDTSFIASLVDRAAGTDEATKAKSRSADVDTGAPNQGSAQVAVPFGLIGVLAGMPTPPIDNKPLASSGADQIQGSAGAKRVGPTTASNAEPAAATALPTADLPMPTADRLEGKSLEARTDSASAPSNAAVAATLRASSDPAMPPATPSTENVAIAAGSLDTRVVAAKARAEKPTDADEPVAPQDTEVSGTTLQSVSVSTQIAPSSSVHARQLTPAGITTATALRSKAAPANQSTSQPTSETDSPDAAVGMPTTKATSLGDRAIPVERASTPTSKTDDPAPTASGQMPTVTAAIADAVSDLADTSATAAAPATTPASTLAPARTMVLQLAPTDLGTVSVRLHLTGQSLDVRLSVSDPKTLGLVSRERDALAARLDDRGYQLNTLTIQGTDSSTSATAGSHDTSQGGAGAARDQASDGGRRGAPDQGGGETGQRAPGDRARGGDASVDSRGGLYI